jgi:flagellar protein FlaF
MSLNCIDAYRQAQQLGIDAQDALETAFHNAALELSDAGRRPDDYGAYAAALERNRLLWTVIQADVADDANELPRNLKDDLLSLSLYVDKQTVQALSRPGASSLEPLIVIDRNLARGLRT